MTHKYDVEIIHEPSGSAMNYIIFSDEEMSIDDIYNDFIKEISVVPTKLLED